MSEIIAYKDQNNEYFDFEIETPNPLGQSLMMRLIS